LIDGIARLDGLGFLTSFSHTGYYLNVFLWLWKIGSSLFTVTINWGDKKCFSQSL